MDRSDKFLMDWYHKGFYDELMGSTSAVPNILYLNKAYELGSIHAIVGDDVRSVDYLTTEEILKLIKE